MKETIERFPGLSEEDFLIRVLEKLTIKVAEINSVYKEGGEEKFKFLRNELYPIHEDTEEILTKIKSLITLRNAIKQEVGLDLFEQQISN